jgi:hypothetical protein
MAYTRRMSTRVAHVDSPDAERIQVELIRRASVVQRMARMRSLSSSVIQLSRRAMRKRHPDWTERQVLIEWMAVHYGRDLAERVRRYMEERGL